jgi:hypothetical protein
MIRGVLETVGKVAAACGVTGREDGGDNKGDRDGDDCCGVESTGNVAFLSLACFLVQRGVGVVGFRRDRVKTVRCLKKSERPLCV